MVTAVCNDNDADVIIQKITHKRRIGKGQSVGGVGAKCVFRLVTLRAQVCFKGG